MRWMSISVALFAAFVTSPVRAQDAGSTPPPSETSPGNVPAGAASEPRISPGPEPPAPRQPPPSPVPSAPPAPADTPAGLGIGLEAATAGFASGNLQGGLLVGMHLPGGSLFGFRIDYRSETRKVGSQSVSHTQYGLGVAGRFAVAGSKAGVDLALALDAAYLKAQIPGPSADGDPIDGFGFHIAAGPQIRYWITPHVAVGYLVEAYFSRVAADTPAMSPLVFGAPPPEHVQETASGIGGIFTLAAAF
jgi:hypothetical protein